MFSGGSVKFMGVCFAFSSLVVGYIGMSLRNETDKTWIFMLVLAAIFGVIAAACLVEAGRAITGRITAAIAFVICTAIFITVLSRGFEVQKLEVEVGDHVVGVRWLSYGQAFFFALMAFTAGYYAVHGRFPEEWTFQELFRWPTFASGERKSKSAKTRKTKRRVRYLDE